MHIYNVPGIMLEIGNTHFNSCEYSLCLKSLSLIKVKLTELPGEMNKHNYSGGFNKALTKTDKLRWQK